MKKPAEKLVRVDDETLSLLQRAQKIEEQTYTVIIKKLLKKYFQESKKNC